MTSWYRCLQSSSCPRHTARSHSTSCSLQGSTPQQGMQNKLQQKWTPRSRCKCLRGMQSKPQLHHCLQSSSCPRHTARFRSTSCIQPSSTRQQDKHCMWPWCRCQQQKNCPRRTLRCPRCCCNLIGSIGRPDRACKQRSHHCPRSSSCPQSTAHYRSMSCSVPSNTLPQDTPSTRSEPRTHSSRCTCPQDTQYKPRSYRCPQ